MENASWIILVVVIIIFVYILYQYLTTSTTTVTSTDLNSSNAPIAGKTVAGPSNMKYTYATWIYVNSWDNTVPHSIVFAPSGSSTGSNSPALSNGNIPTNYDMGPSNTSGNNTSYDFSLFLDENSPTLYCALGATTLNSNTTTTPSNLITITNNFPLQTWVYVVVSVNTNVVDCYLNGKLVISQLVSQQSSITTPSFSNIYLGNGTGPGWDAQMRNFKRFTTASTPQKVWSDYLSQSPNKLSALSSYGLNIDLTKNGSVTNTFTLL
jgi:hypothetical protein